jgi:amino acid permease
MGAISLVAGTTVGAGILALPNTTAPAGFAASAAALGGGAVYAVVTALLLAEVNLNTMCDLGGGGVSIVSMASRTLGTRWLLALHSRFYVIAIGHSTPLGDCFIILVLILICCGRQNGDTRCFWGVLVSSLLPSCGM